MKYLGGKDRYGEEIARVVRSKRCAGQLILEPFCGSCSVSQYLETPLICSDAHRPLIQLHQAVQQGWEPPDFISEEEYRNLHEEWKDGEEGPLIGFVGFACSWGGKWWGGYARDSTRNYCIEAKKLLLKKHKNLKNVKFEYRNYRNHEPRNLVIYCDPPYVGTTTYSIPFDNKLFWSVIRKWSKHNKVVVSEYHAPDDFKIIWEVEDVCNVDGSRFKITRERLYEIR